MVEGALSTVVLQRWLEMAGDTNLNRNKNSAYSSGKGSSNTIEKSVMAPFTFDYLENQLRKKRYGILGTVTPEGQPHSVGVVYGMPPRGQPFCLYLITRPVLRKARNIRSNPNVSFVVPFPHYFFRMLPPASIQFQGKAKFIPIDDPVATKTFQTSIVLHRSMKHSLDLGESTFIRVLPDDKIFSFGINATIWQYFIRSKNKTLGNFHVVVPQDRRFG